MSACAAVTPLRGGTRSYYEPLPPEALAVLFVAALLAFTGLLAVALFVRNRVALAGAGTSGLTAFSVVTGYSIGFFVLPFAVLTLVLLVRQVVLSADRPRAALSAAAGLALGLGSVALWLAYAWPPLVVCHPGGASASSPGGWWYRHIGAGYASGSASSGTTSSQVATGTIRAGDQVVSYRCEDGRLTEISFQ